MVVVVYIIGIPFRKGVADVYATTGERCSGQGVVEVTKSRSVATDGGDEVEHGS
jgi:hypothetical protein